MNFNQNFHAYFAIFTQTIFVKLEIQLQWLVIQTIVALEIKNDKIKQPLVDATLCKFFNGVCEGKKPNKFPTQPKRNSEVGVLTKCSFPFNKVELLLNH